MLVVPKTFCWIRGGCTEGSIRAFLRRRIVRHAQTRHRCAPWQVSRLSAWVCHPRPVPARNLVQTTGILDPQQRRCAESSAHNLAQCARRSAMGWDPPASKSGGSRPGGRRRSHLGPSAPPASGLKNGAAALLDALNHERLDAGSFCLFERDQWTGHVTGARLRQC